MDNDIILKLQDIYSRTLLIPVIGSGLSVPFGLPDWRSLIENAAVFFHLSAVRQEKIKAKLDHYEFLDAVDLVLEGGVSERKLQEFVVDCITEAKKNANLKVENNYTDLAHMPKLRYMTTNYDRFLNDFTGAESFLLSDLEKMQINEFPLKRFDNTVIPLHGEITDSESIVLSRNSYKALYEADDFEREFQHLRTHFTFLFMGFSFDDEYFQKMFRKVLRRFEAAHYILFEKSAEITYKEKIRRLSEEFGVKAIYYDASELGHTRAISRLLDQIFGLKDNSVDISGLTELPEKTGLKMSADEQKIIDKGNHAIRNEALTELFSLYQPEYESSEFRNHSTDFQVEILSGLVWYYGFQRQNEQAEQLIQQVFEDPALEKYTEKLTFLYGQILWNLRKYTDCIQLLKRYGGEKDAICKLFGSIVEAFRQFLPESAEVKGTIPVYEPVERSESERARYHAAYVKLRDAYVNPETYNLLDLDKYGDREAQQNAYYWLGIAAGQLFHEHDDAIQYLLRAYELEQQFMICEELAHNYLAKAEAEIRYCAHPKIYQVDMNSLVKAQIRFQYVMNSKDDIALKSFYESSGLGYLRTLFLLKDYYGFEDFFEKCHEFITDSEDLYLMKAEVDASYELDVSQSTLKHLNKSDRQYITYLCAYNRANLSAGTAADQQVLLYRSILELADREAEPIEDTRVILMLIDCAFFGKDILHYERLKKSCKKELFFDMEELGFEDELYGNHEIAGIKMEKAFEKYKDIGTFHILRSFYIRRKMYSEYQALYNRVLLSPPDDSFKNPQFFMEYILSEYEFWGKIWSALHFFALYGDKLEPDPVRKKETEEALKMHVADHDNYENRIAWNRFMLTKAPRKAQAGIYTSMIQLHIANLQYRRAEEVVQEMKKKSLQPVGAIDKLVRICMEKQSRRFYTHLKTDISSRNLDVLLRQLNGNWRYHSPYFGAEGKEIAISIREVLCMFKQQRVKEFQEFSCIHIMYAGVIHLQNGLWSMEDAFLRMVLQWLGRADNIKLDAPDFKHLCEYAPNVSGRRHSAEEIQLKLFCEEHPEIIRI